MLELCTPVFDGIDDMSAPPASPCARLRARVCACTRARARVRGLYAVSVHECVCVGGCARARVGELVG